MYPNAAPCLARGVDRDDRGVQIDRQRTRQITWSGTSGPQPGQQLPADRVQLPHVGPLVRPQPRPDRRGCPGVVEQRPGSTGAEHGGVIDAVTADQHRPDHRERLRAAVRALPSQPEPLVDQVAEPDALGQRRRRKQPRVRDKILLGEAHRDPGQVMRCSHLTDALLLRCRSVRRKSNPQRTKGICVHGTPSNIMTRGSGLRSTATPAFADARPDRRSRGTPSTPGCSAGTARTPYEPPTAGSAAEGTRC